MRRFNLYAFSWMTAGFVALAVLSPAAAADDKPIDVRFVSMPSTTGATAPDAGYSGLAETNVSVGIETRGVPCIDCVHGAGGNNIGLPFPVFAVPQGSILSISSWVQSTSYTGPCTSALILKQGSTVVFSTSYALPGGCAAGGLYGFLYTVPAPTTTGFTTVISTVSGGPNKSGADTFINVQ